jgi:hypothetical protein
METFAIFEEFTEHAITPDERHVKRMNLEPLIFDILKSKYGKQLADAWAHYKVKPASEVNKTVVIIEPRIHSNLQFLLHNVAYYANGWAITIVCSKKNLQYCQLLAEHNKDVITFLPLFKENLERDAARQEYNRLLKSEEFYQAIPCENMCCIQTDAYLRRHIPDSILDYDYAASPFSWDRDHAGGGITFRKKTVFLDLCRRSKRIIESEDCFASASIQDFGYKMPKWEEGLKFFCESILYANTVGVHQWWTFLRNVPNSPQCKQIFHTLLTLEL